MHKFPNLFAEYQLSSALSLKNRIVMAPMTRAKSTHDFVPTPMMRSYYSKRAAAGLIITEGTIISPTARGHDFVPGIFNAEQIQAWHQITSTVHEQGGIIFSQLWHVGRVSHPSFLNGDLPVSASATVMTGKISRSELQFGEARAATVKELENIVQQYAACAHNAKAAGFDGIEIHAANGYLIDQFLHHHTNQRNDEFGGTPENMSRLALQVIDGCTQVFGADRVAIRLSPGAYLNQIIGDPRDAGVFEYLLNELSNRKIAYTHTGCFDHTAVFPELGGLTMSQFMRRHYRGTLISAGQYTPELADSGIHDHLFDLAAFGRPFIANPDLVRRLQDGQELKAYDVSMLATLD